MFKQTGPRDVVGVDLDPSEAAQARKLGIYSVVHTVGGNRVPEPAASFDWVLSNSVLEHIDNIGPVFDEIARLLRPGGELICTVPGPDFHACLRGPLIPGVSREAYLRKLDKRLAHRRYWSRDEWESALSSHGMHVEAVSSYMTIAEVRRWESISRMTAGVLYGLLRGRRQPIEIQRTLGMRRSGSEMGARMARAVAAAISIGLNGETTNTKFGGLLVGAVKGLGPVGRGNRD